MHRKKWQYLRKIVREPFVPSFFFLLLTFSLSDSLLARDVLRSQGGNEIQSLESILNAVKNVMAAPETERETACLQLKKGQELIKNQFGRRPRFVSLLKQSEEAYKLYCSPGVLANANNFSSPLENGPTNPPAEGPSPTVPPSPSNPFGDFRPGDPHNNGIGYTDDINDFNGHPHYEIWSTPPSCFADPHVMLCDYNHGQGKGLFVLKWPAALPGDQEAHTYLVCGLSALRVSGAVRQTYKIENICRRSTIDFEWHLKERGRESLRPDVKGFMGWIDVPMKRRIFPLAMPSIMLNQCQVVFGDAFFCIPTFMVLPTDDPYKIDVCGLEAEGAIVHVMFFNAISRDSQWKCRRMDRREEILERELSAAEQRCVPNKHGKVRKQCRLPYIPEREETLLVRKVLRTSPGNPSDYSVELDDDLIDDLEEEDGSEAALRDRSIRDVVEARRLTPGRR